MPVLRLWDILPPNGSLAMSADVIKVTTGVGNGTGIQWARDAAKYLTGHRTVLQTKDYPAPNANSTEVEKLCSRQSQVHRSPNWPHICLSRQLKPKFRAAVF